MRFILRTIAAAAISVVVRELLSTDKDDVEPRNMRNVTPRRKSRNVK